eukprot:scaffold5701_cov50-Phaeocystis_antarctica.AAC.1
MAAPQQRREGEAAVAQRRRRLSTSSSSAKARCRHRSGGARARRRRSGDRSSLRAGLWGGHRATVALRRESVAKRRRAPRPTEIALGAS